MDLHLLQKISDNICYTELVYQRVNKKLNRQLSQIDIESLVQQVLKDKDTYLEKQ